MQQPRNRGETDAPASPEEAREPRSEPIVVGIGASAGGLAALKNLFHHVPPDSGLAFVVVVHLSPGHESHLPDLLQPHVKFPVQQVTETVRLEPDRVYVIPPGCNLSAIDTHLRLSDLEESRGARAPIDHFFRTLAETHDGHAIGVILTGTGSDGTLGLKAIKERFGLAIVQDPAEAEYEGMPKSAISTGLVDLVLPLAEIPGAILNFTSTEPRVASGEGGGEPEIEGRLLLQRIFVLVHSRTGRDFSRYKRSTIVRRLQRRMQLRHMEELHEYVALLRQDPDEVQAFADDLLVTVTSFFRDAEIFSKLEAEIVPQIFRSKRGNESVRIWSVGCATGEEAYSLAMLCLEAAARVEGPRPQLQIFASDLHEHSLDRAREGLYAGDLESTVGPERLRRFFSKENSGYRVRKEVREVVVFAPHNLLSDPPFSKLDLISCRNLMIYLERDVQRDVVDLFHYALRPDGFLLLGTSESIDDSALFRPTEKRLCLFRKRNVAVPEPRLPVFPMARSRRAADAAALDPPFGHRGYGELHQRMVERLAPPSLLMNDEGRIVHLSERAGRYLEIPGGEPSANAYKLVRDELRHELREAAQAAKQQRHAVRSKPTAVNIDGTLRYVVLDVRLAPAAEHEELALVIFDERDSAEKPRAEPAPPQPARRADRQSEVETELELTRQRLRALVEEFETSQEEMRSANEELQSSNEELSSAMEELETSKEELQSTNEELQTVNQENRHRVEELSQLSSDLQNLLAATAIATLFLDRELRILRFTPKVEELFNVRATDRGRPLSDLTHRLGYDTIYSDAEQVLKHLAPIEREVRGENGRWYLTRVMPYRSADDRIEGVVITFVEITARKEMEDALRQAKGEAEGIVDSFPSSLLVLGPDLRVLSANPAFYREFRTDPEHTLSLPLWKLGNGQWSGRELRRLLEETLSRNQVFNDLQVIHDAPGGERRVLVFDGRPFDGGRRILLGIRDITERQRAEDARDEAEAALERRVVERTRQVSDSEARVRDLASRLTRAEQSERRRISQVLHHDLQQILYAAEMKLSTLRGDLPPDAAGALDEASRWLGEALTMTRQLSVDLSPPILHNEGLADALRWLQRQMRDMYQFEVTIEEQNGAAKLDDNLHVLIFQTVRELLFNVKKHAGVLQATVRLSRDGNQVVVEVRDTGRGYDSAKPSGTGLRTARERLQLLGGGLEIESAPGRGTVVRLHAPLESHESGGG